MLRLLVAVLWALSLIACDSGPPGSDLGSCDGAPSGPSGGPATDRVLLCALDDRGEPIANAAVSAGGMSLGVTDDSGRIEVDLAPAIEVSAPGLVSHTLLGVSTQRFGVVLARPSAPTRRVTGTVSGINALPNPPDGFRRVVEIRAASLFSPLSLTDGLAVGAPADCTLAGDTCSFEMDIDERVTRLDATVVDTTSAFAERQLAGFAVSEAIAEGPVDFAVPGRDGALEDVAVGSGTDVVVGVPGARIGDQVLLFGSPSSTENVPVPAASLGGSAWLAVIYDGPSDELHAAVVQTPGGSTTAPSPPEIEIASNTLTLPANRVSTLSLGDGTTELWRATVLDGRTTVSVPSGDGDRVAVLIHGSSESGPAADRITDRIEAVVTLPITR